MYLDSSRGASIEPCVYTQTERSIVHSSVSMCIPCLFLSRRGPGRPREASGGVAEERGRPPLLPHPCRSPRHLPRSARERRRGAQPGSRTGPPGARRGTAPTRRRGRAGRNPGGARKTSEQKNKIKIKIGVRSMRCGVDVGEGGRPDSLKAKRAREVHVASSCMG